MENIATGNLFAWVALLAWPVISLLFYRVRSFEEVTIWAVLGGLLLLPSQASIKIPMVPEIDKDSMACVAAMAGWLVFAPRLVRARTGFGLVEFLIVLYVATPVITSLLNQDNIIIGDRFLPGVGLYDGISALIRQCILLSPFLIGRYYLQRTKDVETILRTLVNAGLLFSILALIEIRMSPQLSTWLYGYTPAFAVEYRYGGYRPVVFMANGLTAVFFLATSFLAAVTISRGGYSNTRLPIGAAAAYLAAVIVACKSAGALVYTVVGGSVLRWSRPRMQARVAIFLVCVAILYPALRIAGFFPTMQLVNLAASFNEERAESLQIRFDQEERLLEHASQRFLFGWGRYGRSRIYEESGKDISITDGLWVVTVGQFGIAGFLGQFGLLVVPVFRSVSGLKRIEKGRARTLLAGLVLIVAITVIEQLPNASLSPWSWLLAGCLLGVSERSRSRSPRSRQLNEVPDSSGSLVGHMPERG